MESKILVLYLDEKNGRQSWCMYHGGKEEADGESKMMMDGNEHLKEHGRIEIQTTANLLWMG
jgi:hypothetical protein